MLNLRKKECPDEKNHENKKKDKSTPKLCWADQVKFDFGRRFEGQKGLKHKID